jgi:uncharacterized protein (DUF952 family)
VRLFHIVSVADWAAAEAAGTYAPPSLTSEGFIHFSFAQQVAGTANRYYRALDDLQVLEVDSASLDTELRIEDTTGGGVEFPHVYGALPVGAVVVIHPLSRDASGDYVFSPGA